jgi:hypothetical protein
MLSRLFVTSALALAVPFGLVTSSFAQVLGVSSITTSDITASSAQTRNGLTEFSGANTYNVTYNGIERRLTSFVTGTQGWNPLRSDGVVRVRRSNASGANQSFPLLNPNQTAGWNRLLSSSGTGTVNHTVSGVYRNTMETLFQSNNVFSGTENLFVNDDTANAGNPNVVTNIERMDFIFPTSVNASPNIGFAVFERGLGTGGGGSNGTFRIAAITSVDGTGNPTGFSSTVLRVTPADYNNGGAGVGTLGQAGLNTLNYDVTRFATAAGPELDFMNNANLGPQGIAGALIRTNLLVPTGTPVFGYAVFGDDVTATGNQLLDINNTTFFPQASPFSNDMDMVATGAVIYAVPEPTTWALIIGSLGVAGYGLVRYRRRNQQLRESEVIIPAE